MPSSLVAQATTAVEECDARDDDSSNADGLIKIEIQNLITYFFVFAESRVMEFWEDLIFLKNQKEICVVK